MKLAYAIRERGLLIIGLALLANGTAQAETYVGAQANMMRVDRGSLQNAELTGVVFRGGVVMHALLSAEVRIGKGFGDDKVDGITLENDYFYGAYARLTPPVPWPVAPYLIGGYSYVENEVNDSMQRDDGMGYGGGFDMGVSDSVSINLEYLRLVNNDYGKQELIGLGANFFF